MTSQMTLPRAAPRAMRMPTSRVRWATVVSHDAVETNDREQSGEEAEDGGEAGDHAFGGKGFIDGHFRGAHGVDGHVGIHVANGRTNRGHQLIGIGSGADIDGHSSEEAVTKIRNVGLLGNFVAKVGVLEILDDADDFHVGGRAGVGAKAEVQAEGISAGKIFFGKFLVDHDGGGHPVPFFGAVFDDVAVVHGEVAPGDDGHAQSSEIVGADRVHVGFGMFVRLGGREALDGHAAVPFVVFENAHGSEANGANSGNGAEDVSHLRIENFQALRSVAVEGRIDLEADQPFRGEAWAEIAQVRETANKKTGAYQEQERKSYLRDDEAFSQAMVATATDDSAGLIF